MFNITYVINALFAIDVVCRIFILTGEYLQILTLSVALSKSIMYSIN